MSIAEQVMAPFSGRHFLSLESLHRAVVDEFNKNLELLPPHYYYTQLIDWSISKGWIVHNPDGTHEVKIW